MPWKFLPLLTRHTESCPEGIQLWRMLFAFSKFSAMGEMGDGT